jgi:hypothetical protein
MKKALLFGLVVLFLSAASTVYSATTYEVWRNTTNISSSATRIGEWVSGTTFNDTTASPGQNYYYWVKVVTANTVYGYKYIVGDWIELHVWATIPTASHRSYQSPIKTTVRLVPFGFSWTGNLTNRLMESDVLLDDNMDEWYYNNITIGGTTSWERT